MKCSVCGKSFSSIRALNNHLNSTGHRRGGGQPANTNKRNPPPRNRTKPGTSSPTRIIPPTMHEEVVTYTLPRTVTTSTARALHLTGPKPASNYDDTNIPEGNVIHKVEVEVIVPITVPDDSRVKWIATPTAAPITDVDGKQADMLNAKLLLHGNKTDNRREVLVTGPFTRDAVTPRLISFATQVAGTPPTSGGWITVRYVITHSGTASGGSAFPTI